jgi:hypothetical protein
MAREDEFSIVVDAEGNKMILIGDTVVEGGLSRPGEIGHQRAEAAEVAASEDDVAEQQYTVQNDPDAPLVIEEMRRRSKGLGEDMVNLVSYNHKAFNAAYAATKESMIEIQGNDHGRQGELDRLREALQEERAENPRRQTPRDKAIVDRISDLTTRGIY